ncbi:hypothetical protein Z950_409 [Sulfitobacter mediterraneus KCTC 32188]|nr:hypothetical protein Z950_409 [Sulfitobacter mediterraneus KCTC 32188]
MRNGVYPIHNIMPTTPKATSSAIIAMRPDILGSGLGSCMGRS